jgi:hypothetical protein
MHANECRQIIKVAHHWGGIVGGLRFIAMFGACNFGRGPVGGTKLGCYGGFKVGG